MIYPNIWGNGALFAFSGIEGTNTLKDSMCGQLMSEHIGIAFDSHRVEMYLRLKEVSDFSFEAVASDVITGKFNQTEPFGFLFLKQNAVLGYCPENLAKPCCHADLLQKKEMGDTAVFSDGEHVYAFLSQRRQGRIFFALCRTEEEQSACEEAAKALQADPQEAAMKKMEYFKRVPVDRLTDDEAKTLCKCFSVMKTQIYTPEGRFRQRWSTPDRLPHKYFWLWDSVFHSFGNVHIDPMLAYETVRSLFDVQRPDGFIPHMSAPDWSSEVTQPPVIAWGIYKLYEKTGRTDWLSDSYDSLKRYLEWNFKNRDTNHNYLFEWDVNPDSPNCRCDECGMDNSPRFDAAKPMDCIDFSCYMAHELRCMEKIAALLGKTEDAAHCKELFERIRDAVNTALYDREDGRYYDRETESKTLKKVSAVSSFLPLFAGICTKEQAALLVKDLFDPATFGTRIGIPSISKKDRTFGTDMWRGPVWINFNYMIACGLRDYGYREEAARLTEGSLSVMTEWYLKEGVIFEFYDSNDAVCPSDLSRKGASLKPREMGVRMSAIRDYGWSAALYAAMMLERESEGGVSK